MPRRLAVTPGGNTVYIADGAARDAGDGSDARDGVVSVDIATIPDLTIPDASVPILTYDSTEAAGCESLRPQLSVPPSVATLREDPAAPCGLPYEADLHGRVIFGCWDSRPDGGPTYKLVESGGHLVRNLAGDVHVEDFIGYAARDGLRKVFATRAVEQLPGLGTALQKFAAERAPVAESELLSIRDRMTSRGPDGAGVWPGKFAANKNEMAIAAARLNIAVNS